MTTLPTLAAPGGIAQAATRTRWRLPPALVRLALVALVLLVVWLPHLRHFHIDRGLTELQWVQALQRQPDDATLQAVAATSLAARPPLDTTQTLQLAQRILEGEMTFPGLLTGSLPLHGHPQDYLAGPPTYQLVMAGLAAEDILLEAYEHSRQERFLQQARARVLAFAAHERQQHLGDGFLWNDHAIAARVGVLVRLWRLVRSRSDLGPDEAQALLSLAARSGRFLAHPEHFTVRTNHGVMQNVALLQLSAAFPALPEAGNWQRLALQRLRYQLPFYVSPEGMVLEHSADYHLMGVQLLTSLVRLRALNGLPADDSLSEALRRSRDVLAALMRPDGSLPLVGNTSRGTGLTQPWVPDDGSAPVQQRPPQAPAEQRPARWLPVSGYALWWLPAAQGAPAQTVVAWAKHDGHGHKHADEGSVLFWSGGMDWLTATGYWPYGAALQEQAYGWRGSNAPHLLGEATGSPREVELLRQGERGEHRFLELARRGEGAAQLRRQVLQLDADTLLVLDFAQGAARGTEVVWTTDARLRLAAADGDGFLSSPAPDGRRLGIAQHAAPTASWSLQRGSTEPFAGWTVVERQPLPADALRVHNPAPDSVTATLFDVRAAAQPARVPRIGWDVRPQPEHWQLWVERRPGERYVLQRHDDQITIEPDPGKDALTVERLALQAPPDIGNERAALRQAYLAAVAAFPPWRDLSVYRLRLTWLVLAVALTLELGRWLLQRLVPAQAARVARPVHWLVCLGWLVLAGLGVPLYLHP